MITNGRAEADVFHSEIALCSIVYDVITHSEPVLLLSENWKTYDVDWKLVSYEEHSNPTH